MDNVVRSDRFIVKHLDWDTKTLGIKSCLIKLRDINNMNSLSINYIEELTYIIECIRSKEYKFITLKIPSQEKELILFLNKYANLMYEEVKYIKEKNEFKENIYLPKEYTIEKIKIYWHDNLENLGEVQRESRFFKDKNIGYSSAKKIWKESIYNSCNGRATYNIICFYKNKPIGLMNIMENKNESDLFLIGILKEYQRKGIGNLMMKYYEQNLDKAIKFQTVETQRNNIGAIRLYTNRGYKEISSQMIYHLWL